MIIAEKIFLFFLSCQTVILIKILKLFGKKDYFPSLFFEPFFHWYMMIFKTFKNGGRNRKIVIKLSYSILKFLQKELCKSIVGEEKWITQKENSWQLWKPLF